MDDDDVDALKSKLAAAQREIESLQLRLANVTLLLRKEMLLSIAERAPDSSFRTLKKAVNECPETVEELERKASGSSKNSIV